MWQLHYDGCMPNTAASSSRLAELRCRLGITLEEIADATKINVRYLRAIETGRLEELPGGVYRTSYVRQYSEQIMSRQG